jgi:predicted MPP superfamily phosphohydrolase
MRTGEKIVLIVFLVSITAVYAVEIFLIVSLAVSKLRTGQTPKTLWSKPALLVHSLAIIGIICLLYARFVEPYRLEVKTIPLRTEKLTQTSFRIVHISDLHCDKKPRNETRLIELVNAAKPDIIVFSGDTLRLHTPAGLPRFKDTMRSLQAPLAKLAVLGNVDIWHLPDLDFFGGTGFQQLDAKTVRLKKNGEEICISGLSPEFPDYLGDLLQSIPENRFSIFLYHYPDLIEDINDLNVDLYLAGHTHGGQIALPFYGALITLSKFGKKYESGMYTVGHTILYVNRGIGGHATNIRFFARPEITIFDLGPNKTQAD